MVLSQELIAEGARKELARRSYADYVEYVHNGFYTHARHTHFLCHRLDKLTYQENQRIVIAMPPRHSKSMTTTETYPSWYLSKHPRNRVILSAYAHDLAEGFSRRNRAKISEFGKTLFNVGLSEEKAAADNWEMDNKVGGLIAAGIGGAITGKGANLLIIDDPIKNKKEADSFTYRKRVWEEWEATLNTRLAPGANVILIMTMWHEDDLANRLIKTGDWEVIKLPCIATDDNDILGRSKGEVLWSEFGYDQEWAKQKKKEVGSRVWSALYQQSPIPDEGMVFKKEWFRFYRKNNLPALTNELQSWDFVFKKTDTTDFVVGQVWGKDNADAYLTYQWRNRASYTESKKAMRMVTKAYPQTKIKLVEDKANGSAIIDELQKDIPGIIAVEPEGSKEARANAITPYFEAGNVWFPHPDEAPWVEDLITELLAFPNGSNDDQVDALSQALARIYIKKKAKVKSFKGGL